MEMELTILDQTISFFYSVLTGVVSGLIYELFAGIKNVFLKNKILKDITDIRFVLTLFVFLMFSFFSICGLGFRLFHMTMKDLLEKAGREYEFEVASAATSTEEIWNGIGNPVYPPAKKLLAKKGIDCSGKRARQMTKADYDHYDMLIGMDNWNIRNMMRIIGSDPEGKIRMLMDFTDRPGEVADPWYSGDFETTYRDVLEGCEGILRASLG